MMKTLLLLTPVALLLNSCEFAKHLGESINAIEFDFGRVEVQPSVENEK